MPQEVQRWAVAVAVWALVLGGLAGCGPADAPGTAGGRAPVTFTATEYAYDGPESISGGMTAIELVNAGEQPHSLLFMGFPEDKTLEDVTKAVEAATSGSAGIPEWVTFPGGVGGSSRASAAAPCWIWHRATTRSCRLKARKSRTWPRG